MIIHKYLAEWQHRLRIIRLLAAAFTILAAALSVVSGINDFGRGGISSHSGIFTFSRYAHDLCLFRFEYLWPFWLLVRSIYDSFKYQGLVSILVFTINDF